MKRLIDKRFFTAITLSVCSFLCIYPVFGYVMESNNYRIESDSLNVGGGDYQESDNYFIRDTLGEVSTGISETENYKLKAGYRQMTADFYISISSPLDVTMLPNILGMTGGTATGEASWTVLTDNPAGYSMVISASSSPALVGQSQGDSLSDYTPTNSGTPDFNWSVADDSAEFGFTAEGSDIVKRFKDSAGVCDIDDLDTSNSCWYNFSTSNLTISDSSLPNHPAGTGTTVKFKAQLYNEDGVPNSGSGMLLEDTYQATITVTAVAL
ncbi:MAG: hypothetical protein PHI53_02275 [Candidatus Pacebacteria bacterium]|nr:hypothetical protein [Candidatus Paceibacterota bacterium]